MCLVGTYWPQHIVGAQGLPAEGMKESSPCGPVPWARLCAELPKMLGPGLHPQSVHRRDTQTSDCYVDREGPGLSLNCQVQLFRVCATHTLQAASARRGQGRPM